MRYPDFIWDQHEIKNILLKWSIWAKLYRWSGISTQSPVKEKQITAKMSATREKEIILNFRNNIEYSLFNKDGVENIKVLEQIASCVSEQREIFGKKIISTPTTYHFVVY